MKLSAKITALIIMAALGYFAGSYRAMQYHYQVLQAQWDGEIRRFEYAYSITDECATDMCLEGWSELLGRDVEAK